MTPADVIARLLDLPPLRLEAIALFIRLQRDPPADASAVVSLQPQIDAAARELEAHADKAKALVKRCQHLQPSPSNSLPCGF